MPIKINVVDNNSEVRVKLKSNDEVKLKPDCGLENGRLESLINTERAERIEADKLLQDTKQDLGYIQVEPYLVSGQLYGIFSEGALEKLKKYLVNKLSFEGYIYSLSVSNGNKKIYFCPREIERKKIEVDFETGIFGILASDEHAVTQEMIDFWNNKVTAYAANPEIDPIDQTTNNTLVLTKENILL